MKYISFPMEMHMVHINSKYVFDDGELDESFLTAEDGLSVLGFMFELGDGVMKSIHQKEISKYIKKVKQLLVNY